MGISPGTTYSSMTMQRDRARGCIMGAGGGGFGEEVLELGSLTSHELMWSTGETGELRSTQYLSIVSAPLYFPYPLFQSEKEKNSTYLQGFFLYPGIQYSYFLSLLFFYLESRPWNLPRVIRTLLLPLFYFLPCLLKKKI